jgi:hypothetical protein
MPGKDKLVTGPFVRLGGQQLLCTAKKTLQALLRFRRGKEQNRDDCVYHGCSYQHNQSFDKGCSRVLREVPRWIYN